MQFVFQTVNFQLYVETLHRLQHFITWRTAETSNMREACKFVHAPNVCFQTINLPRSINDQCASKFPSTLRDLPLNVRINVEHTYIPKSYRNGNIPFEKKLHIQLFYALSLFIVNKYFQRTLNKP